MGEPVLNRLERPLTVTDHRAGNTEEVSEPLEIEPFDLGKQRVAALAAVFYDARRLKPLARRVSVISVRIGPVYRRPRSRRLRVCRLSVLALLGLTAPLAAGAAPTKPAQVNVGETGLSPTHVTINVGGRVTWTNTGKLRHRVASDTNAWAAFTLAPRKTHAVRFSKAGRFPYHVDGKRTGVVLVRTTATSATTSTNGATTSTNGLVVNHYAVTITYTATAKGHAPLGSAGDEVWSNAEQWSYSWLDFPVLIFPDNTIGGNAKSGTIQEAASFSYHDAPGIQDPTNCTGAVPTQTYKDALGVIDAIMGQEAVTDTFGWSSETEPMFGDTLTKEVASRCFGSDVPSAQLAARPPLFSFTLPDGIKFGIVGDTGWTIPGLNTPKKFPLSALIAGRSFGIESGNQSQSTSIGSGGQQSVTEAISVKFTFLRTGAA